MANKVAVIGAGASGLMAAMQAAKAGAGVVLIDGNDKAGKKLYATGNGRCNFTNINCDGSAEALRRFFNSSAEAFAAEALAGFDAEDCIDFFCQQGVLARQEDQGRCYPYSGQAGTIVAALERGCREAGVELILGDAAVEVFQESAGKRFTVVCQSGCRFQCDAVVLACGGRAGLKYGSTGDGYGFAKGFGHSLVAPKPALVAAESEAPFIAELKGVRAAAKVELRLDGEIIASDQGEVQFTGTGISGICVFDLSRFMEAPRPKKKKKNSSKQYNTEEVHEKKYEIIIDLAPDVDTKELRKLFQFWVRKYCSTDEKENAFGEISKFDLEQILTGIVNKKLAAVISNLAVEDEFNGKRLSDVNKLIGRAVMLVKGLKVPISSTKGWDDAQTTSGGVNCTEVNNSTMESKLQPGLFLCGEILDVDGKCGGYNLQWAWASGYMAGRNAAK